MGTLLKYEFCRSRTIFLGIIGVTLLIELVYLIGFFTKIKALFAVGLIGGILCLVNHNDNEFIGCESYGRVISDRPDNDYKGTFFGQCKKAAKFRNCIAQGDVGTYNGGDCIMTGVNADNYMDYLGAYDASAVDVTPANILYRPAGN